MTGSIAGRGRAERLKQSKAESGTEGFQRPGDRLELRDHGRYS